MQLPLHLIDPPQPRLNDGVIGQNAAALDALRQTVQGEGQGFATLLIWGAPGSGKSFWLKAWAAALGSRAQSIDCDRNAASALPRPSPADAIDAGIEAMGGHASARIWLIDNVDRADTATADALFRLYNAAREHSHRVVAAASAPPLRLGLRDDLRTRLGQGLIFELHELNDQEKRDALRERAQQLALPLPEELLNYLITYLPRDLGLLTKILDELNTYALSQKRPATIPLLKELLDLPHATTRPV
jgi:DnaA-homolog protein